MEDDGGDVNDNEDGLELVSLLESSSVRLVPVGSQQRIFKLQPLHFHGRMK